MCVRGPIRPERRYPAPLDGEPCERVVPRFPSSVAGRAPLGRRAACSRKGWRPFRMSPDRDPRLDVPREGERRRGNQDAFYLPGTGRVSGVRRSTWFALSRPLVTRPHPEGRWLCNREARAFLFRSVLRRLALTRQATGSARRTWVRGFRPLTLDSPRRPRRFLRSIPLAASCPTGYPAGANHSIYFGLANFI